jgi:hypothetical protein
MTDEAISNLPVDHDPAAGARSGALPPPVSARLTIARMVSLDDVRRKPMGAEELKPAPA